MVYSEDRVKTVEDTFNKKADIKFLPLQPGDVEVTYADIDDLMKDFNYKPITDINRGINEFILWYKKFYEINN